MKKAITFFSLGILCGCMSQSVLLTPPKDGVAVATLTIKAKSAENSGAGTSRIYTVDRTYFPLESQDRVVFLSPGKHRVGINCTNLVYIDEQPSIVFKFLAAKQYEVVCNGDTPELLLVGALREPS